MKKHACQKSRAGLLGLCLALILCLMMGTAQADSLTTDKLQLTLTADQDAYTAGEQIRLILTARNTGAAGLELSSAVETVPENVIAQNPRTADSCLLPANEIHTREFLFTVRGAAASLPQTGDDSQPLLWLVLAALSAVGVLCMGSKARARFLSLVLCLALMSSFCPEGLTLARAEGAASAPEAETAALAGDTEFDQLCARLLATNPLTAPSAAIASADQKLEINETVLVQGKRVTLTVVVGVSETEQSKAVSGDAGSDIRASKARSMLDKPLTDTFVTGRYGTTIVYAKQHTGDSTVLPSTGGSYSSGVDYLYCLAGGEGVNSMTLFFGDSYQLENGWDAVLVYDGYGRYVDAFTGEQLKNKVLTVTGSGVFLRLVTDSSITKSGFSVIRAIPNRTPAITSCVASSTGMPVISWNRMYGYTGYIVERATVSASGSVSSYSALTNVPVSSSSATRFSYTDNTAVRGTRYAYRLRQRFVYDTATLVSPPSAAKYITVGTSASIPAPTLVSASASSNGITVRWNAVPGITKYWVIRRTEGGSWATVKKGATGTSYTDTTARYGVRYYYTVRCMANDGVTALSSYNTPGVSAVGPAVAPKLTSATQTANGITVKWSAVPGISKYWVIRRTEGGSWTTVKKGVSGTSYTDTTAQYGVRYYYTVRCLASDGVTAVSSYNTPGVSAMGPARVPTLVSATASSAGITVRWNAVPNVTKYWVIRRTEGGSWATVKKGATGTSYVDATAKYGVRYYYSVRCLSNDGETAVSSYSTPGVSAVGATTAPVLSAPANLRAATNQKGYVSIAWNAVTNASGYEVYYASSSNGSFTRYGTTTTASLVLSKLPTSVTKPVIKVRAYRTSNGSTTYGPYSSTVTGNPVIRRALLVGNTYPGTSNLLRGPGNDVKAMKTMLGLQKGTPFTVTGVTNLTASGIRNYISSTFSSADSNDVSLFYYSGHGASNGSLCGVSNTYVSTTQLRNYLDAVPGKKIVLIDACYSGKHINKGLTETDDAKSFNDAMIAAFADESDNLTTSDYIVITACSKYQTSSELGMSNGFYFGAFTCGVTYGSGFNMLQQATCQSWADTEGNNDGKVTLGEAYDFTIAVVKQVFELRQNTQMHGDRSYMLWSRN